jgi:MFS family permease
MNHTDTLRRVPFVPVAFFFTGATSLVFETVWFRRLTLLFGATGYAAATVFTAFMAGLALGALVAGRLTERLRTARELLTAYALLEAASASRRCCSPSPPRRSSRRSTCSRRRPAPRPPPASRCASCSRSSSS